MAYGGGGFAISYPLAKALEKMQDRCIQRYPGLYGSDDRIHACMAELGFPLTKEPGFHQAHSFGQLRVLIIGVHYNEYNQTKVSPKPFYTNRFATTKPGGGPSLSHGATRFRYRGIFSVRELEMPARTFLNCTRQPITLASLSIPDPVPDMSAKNPFCINCLKHHATRRQTKRPASKCITELRTRTATGRCWILRGLIESRFTKNPTQTYGTSFFVYDLSLSFSPIDNYLINCGASLDSVIDNRRFVSDSSDSPESYHSSAWTFSLCAGTLLPGLPQIYHTASFFNAPSKYVVNVKDPGMHMYVNGDQIEKFEGLNKQAFEVVYRVTVGGVEATPFNDSLWRTWMPDDAYMKSSEESTKSKNASIRNTNLTWEFPVIEDYKYLVKMHFRDIASISIGLLFFDVYVNGHLAYKDLDLSAVTNYVLASLFYVDFVVDADRSGVVSVSVGPSSKSMAYTVDAILNGVEIMKMNNSVSSLEGKAPEELLLKCWPRRIVGILLPLIALLCLLLSFSGIMHRRKNKADTVAWSKLPMDVHKISSKQAKLQLSNIET
ncbi:putative Ferric reduction oxidase 2 [Hibiscus syriacus]|uniref:Ferric reduction oxidase 2 n=1 Tax=Hibiscus syriacus TaxID=106335 RepID=A0A6A3CC26_HIBSY|nr:putative Ferric reduction oxidase 2 [Hibiscus syriacus]